MTLIRSGAKCLARGAVEIPHSAALRSEWWVIACPLAILNDTTENHLVPPLKDLFAASQLLEYNSRAGRSAVSV